MSAPRHAQAGSAILWVDSGGTALFALTAIVEAIVLTRWAEVIGVAVALGLFVVGCLAFLLGYARAVQRSRTDHIDVGSLFLLMGPGVPRPAKRVLWGLLAVQILVAVVTAAARPFTPLAFGVLVPVFGVGLNGLWAARHGRFPPRPSGERRAEGAPEGGASPRISATTPADPHAAGGMEQNAGHG